MILGLALTAAGFATLCVALSLTPSFDEIADQDRYALRDARFHDEER